MTEKERETTTSNKEVVEVLLKESCLEPKAGELLKKVGGESYTFWYTILSGKVNENSLQFLKAHFSSEWVNELTVNVRTYHRQPASKVAEPVEKAEKGPFHTGSRVVVNNGNFHGEVTSCRYASKMDAYYYFVHLDGASQENSRVRYNASDLREEAESERPEEKSVLPIVEGCKISFTHTKSTGERVAMTGIVMAKSGDQWQVRQVAEDGKTMRKMRKIWYLEGAKNNIVVVESPDANSCYKDKEDVKKTLDSLVTNLEKGAAKEILQYLTSRLIDIISK